MCNCNNKRTEYRSGISRQEKDMVKVLLIENKPQTLHGNITGRAYIFRKMHDSVRMDKRDAISMERKKELQIMY